MRHGKLHDSVHLSISQRRIHVGVAIEGLHTRQNLPVVAAVDQHLRKNWENRLKCLKEMVKNEGLNGKITYKWMFLLALMGTKTSVIGGIFHSYV